MSYVDELFCNPEFLRNLADNITDGEKRKKRKDEEQADCIHYYAEGVQKGDDGCTYLRIISGYCQHYNDFCHNKRKGMCQINETYEKREKKLEVDVKRIGEGEALCS